MWWSASAELKKEHSEFFPKTILELNRICLPFIF